MSLVHGTKRVVGFTHPAISALTHPAISALTYAQCSEMDHFDAGDIQGLEYQLIFEIPNS